MRKVDVNSRELEGKVLCIIDEKGVKDSVVSKDAKVLLVARLGYKEKESKKGFKYTDLLSSKNYFGDGIFALKDGKMLNFKGSFILRDPSDVVDKAGEIIV